jgi:hypothetical protein
VTEWAGLSIRTVTFVALASGYVNLTKPGEPDRFAYKKVSSNWPAFGLEMLCANRYTAIIEAEIGTVFKREEEACLI